MQGIEGKYITNIERKDGLATATQAKFHSEAWNQEKKTTIKSKKASQDEILREQERARKWWEMNQRIRKRENIEEGCQQGLRQGRQEGQREEDYSGEWSKNGRKAFKS